MNRERTPGSRRDTEERNWGRKPRGGTERQGVTTAEIQDLNKRFNDLLNQKRGSVEDAAEMKKFAVAVNELRSATRGDDMTAIAMADAELEKIFGRLQALPNASGEALVSTVTQNEPFEGDTSKEVFPNISAAENASQTASGVAGPVEDEAATSGTTQNEIQTTVGTVVPEKVSSADMTNHETRSALRTSVEEMRKLMDASGMHSMEADEYAALDEPKLFGQEKMAHTPRSPETDEPHDDQGRGHRAAGLAKKPLVSVELRSGTSAEVPPLAHTIRAEKLNREDGFAELAGVQNEREELLAAERALHSRESEFVGEHSALGRMVQNVLLTKKTQELQRAELGVDDKAAAYYRALEGSLANRLTAKGFTPGTPEFEKVAERYRERVASKDIIDRGEQTRVANRAAALEQKGSNAFEKGLHALASLNAGLEKSFLGKYGARGVRIVASATLASVVASLLSPLSAVAVAGYAGSRVVRSVVGAGVGGVAGVGAGGLYQKFGGARAEKKLADSRKTTAYTFENIRDMREAYRSGNTESVARKRKIAEMVAAALVGGAASFSTAYAEALFTAPDTATALLDHGTAPAHIAPTGVPSHDVPNQLHLEPDATPNHPHIVGGPPSAELSPAGLPHPDAVSPGVPPVEATPGAVTPVETLATVHATPGHGYEYMLKRLSEQLHSQHVDVSHLDPTSDAYKLATASPHNIDTLVHQMASDPTHNFFRGPDGSVRIGLTADLSVNADGSIEFNDGSGHLYVQAPSDAPLTQNVTHATVGAHADRVPSEAQVQQTAERLRAWHAANPDVPNMVPHVDAAGDVYGPPGAHTVDPPWSLEPRSAGVSHAFETFTNPHGVEVNLAQPHVYALEGGRVIVDGGSYDERLQVAIGYVQQHGGSVHIEAKAPVRVHGVLTRYLETVKKAGPFGLGGHIETSRLVGSPRIADVLSDSQERFATRFIKKLQ